MTSPFKFLDSYGIRDKDVFFGREKEVDALYALVFKTPLTLLYGLSGTGKTSIIQCGLANRFDGPDWLPFFIRREQDINQSLRKALLDALGEPSTADLPGLISALFDDYLRPAYLIFDQFEELFILGSPEEQALFAAGLRQLLDRKLPCRIILVIREEYLGQLYPLEKEIPTLFDHRLRIEPMNNARVQEVLEKSFDKFNIALEAPAAELRQAIIDKVSAGKSGIQLPYLQVYLDMLYREDYRRDYGERERGEELPPLEFTRQEIEDFGKIDDVLDKFLREQAEVLQAELAAAFPGLLAKAVRLVLDAFVTEDGTKRPVFLQAQEGELRPEAPFLALFPEISPPALTGCLRRLEQSRLLRITENSAELAHDSLAALIDRQRTDEQRQLNEVKRRIAAAQLEQEKTGVWPTERQLLSMEEFLPKIRLAPHLQQFVQDSYAELVRQKEEAERERQWKLEEAERRAEEERALRTAAEQAQKRSRQRTRIAVFVALLAVAGLLLAVWKSIEANEATKKAQDATEKALDSEEKAQKAQQEALDSAAVAQEQRRIANEKVLETLKANENTAEALKQLQITADQALTIVLPDIDRNIYRLEYDATYPKCRTALNLKARRREVEKRVWEIAYFYTEADSAAAALAFLNLLKPAGLRAGTPGIQAKLRAYLAATMPAEYLKHLENRYYPKTILVESGSFLGEDSVQVQVDGFRMSEAEITYWQYNVFAQARNYHIEPPSWEYAGDNPAVYVNWYDAAFYLNWLSDRHGKKKVYTLANPRPGFWGSDYDVEIDSIADGYRMPTEAQGEFAARGGKYSKGYEFSGDSTLANVGWYEENSNSRTHTVKQKNPNELGLYDMSGNVWEWCQDWYEESSARVIRGGSWSDRAEYCRVASRPRDYPASRLNKVGFRLAFVP